MVRHPDSCELLFDPIDFYSENCTCLLSTSCRSLIAICDSNGNPLAKNCTLLFTVPGFFTGCYKVEALLSSTLECFYSADCMGSLNSALLRDDNERMMNITLLNASLSQADETIGLIVNRIFVDKWLSNFSFATYYQTCAPHLCTFEESFRKSVFSILTTVVSIFGGLTTSLKILFFILLGILRKIRVDQPFRAHVSSVTIWFRNLFKRERLATRLRNLALLITLVALCLFSWFTEVKETIEYLKPSLEIYQQLFQRFPDALQCPCTKVSFEYETFLNISVPNQHQICSSDFVSSEWFGQLVVPHHLSAYSIYDFRNSAISHFQLLAFLCRITRQHLNDTLFDLTRNNFISSQLVSSVVFDEQIQTTFKEFQLTMINSLLITLQLIRDITSANTLTSLLQTNWKWIGPVHVALPGYMKVVHLEPMTYDNCTCALTSQCVKPGIVSDKPILGLMVGCYPLESLLKSTFECLYDVACFSQLQTSNRSFTPLNASLISRYSIKSTVESILNELMTEEWSRNISYERYYTECAPSSCHYSYVGPPWVVDVLINILGLYGGLMIITSAVVSMSVTFWQYVIHRQNNRVQIEAATQ